MITSHARSLGCRSLLRAGATLGIILAFGGVARNSLGAVSARELLTHLTKGHPRLMLTAPDVDELKQRIASDDRLKGWEAKIHAHGQEILKLKPTIGDPSNGEHNLVLTRQVEDRVRTLAYLYLIEGDRAYVERAWQELEIPSQVSDWGVKHFLDVGEMTLTFAIGYDWLYDAWTPAQRATLVQAMVKNGLNPGLANPWWKKVRHNWNLVINGGIGVGALAIADEEPEIAAKALQIALDSAPYAMESYAPDGAWAEGVGYWDYATTFAVYLMSSLQSATGSDAGLSEYPGFAQTGMFPIQMTGPIDLAFNFGDAPQSAINSPTFFWLAHRFNLPLCATFQEKYATAAVMNMVWYRPEGPGVVAGLPSRAMRYQNVGVVCMRGAWNDQKAAFVGFRAGDNKANHSHLDLGTFVFDVGGYRFARQGGAESYSKPGYFDTKKLRWSYYRTRAEGTNTLVINPGAGPDQDPTAAAELTNVNLEAADPFAVANLTAGYAVDAKNVRRGVRLIGGRQLLVQDEIVTNKPSEIWWFMHTKAETSEAALSRDGRSITLKGMPEGAGLIAEILSPADACFQVLPASPLPGTDPAKDQSENAGVRKLAIQLKNATRSTIAVTLTPVNPGDAASPKPKLMGLDQW